ncbi:MAG: 3'-5' exonuclease [Nanoarchaeota archaeon]
MIVIDIETSGKFDPVRNGICQIGAIEFENPSNTFFQEARIDTEDFVEEESLLIMGKTESELRDNNLQSQKELLKNFFKWVSKIETKIFAAHNTPFDYGFIAVKAKKYGLANPFRHRTYDLHVFAAMKILQLNGEMPISNGRSTLCLPKILEFCGIKDTRIKVDEGVVVKNGTPHNGLDDAKLEAECISRILYGKGLLEEFNKFKIPKFLTDK